MRISLVRHGESEGNVGTHDYSAAGDHLVQLTEKGRQQAYDAGWSLRNEIYHYGDQPGPLVYCSPYVRARQTLEGMLDAGRVTRSTTRVYEDARLREVDHGYDSVQEQEAMRAVHGYFYYRYKGGESPADCFDRMSTFLESMMRQVERKKPENVIIVTHGLAIRCFVMRFMHLTVEQFESLANPGNCAIITIDHKDKISPAVFTSGRWAVTGIGQRYIPESA
jgi:broad specificity phosphatase PhoE